MSKFEINRITIELIRAILRFRFTSLAPMSKFDSIPVAVLDPADRFGKEVILELLLGSLITYPPLFTLFTL
jgi:hypothetical protein